MSAMMDLFGVIVDDDSTPEQTHEASLWLGEAINLTPDSDPERFSVHCGSLRGVRRVIGSIVDDRGDVFEVTVHRPAKDGGDVAWHGIVSPGDMP